MFGHFFYFQLSVQSLESQFQNCKEYDQIVKLTIICGCCSSSCGCCSSSCGRCSSCCGRCSSCGCCSSQKERRKLVQKSARLWRLNIDMKRVRKIGNIIASRTQYLTILEFLPGCDAPCFNSKILLIRQLWYSSSVLDDFLQVWILLITLSATTQKVPLAEPLFATCSKNWS